MVHELYHYGILGQKWGVRRFQNADGTYTEEGKRRKRHDKIVRKENDIYGTMSKKERYYLAGKEDERDYASTDEHSKYVVYSFVKTLENTPVSFLDIWQDSEESGAIAISVRSDKRWQGLAKEAVEKGLEYFKAHPELGALNWYVNMANKPSIELAKKYGFVEAGKLEEAQEYVYRKYRS